jgi:chitin deacetylase
VGKQNPLLLQSLIFIAVAMATCSLIVSLNQQIHSSPRTKITTEPMVQAAPVVASRPQSPIPLIPLKNGTSQNNTLKSEKRELFSVSVQSNHSTLPATLKPNRPTDTITPPQSPLQQPSTPPEDTASPISAQNQSVSPEATPDNFSGEPINLNVLIPPKFQAQVVKDIKPIGQEKVIALTFDDGPWPSNTPKILKILQQNNIKATFFWIGKALQEHPQIAKQVVAEGHIVGNHTWHHWYHRLDSATAARELDDTSELIYKITGVKTNLFRPPGGIMDNGVVDYAKNKKNVIVMWSNDPMDYRPHSAQQLVNNVVRKAQPGGIILMHDGGGEHPATVKALPKIIAKLTEQGYKFLTIPELLAFNDLKESQEIVKQQATNPAHLPITQPTDTNNRDSKPR